MSDLVKNPKHWLSRNPSFLFSILGIDLNCSLEDGEPGYYYGSDIIAYRKLTVTDERQCKKLCWFDPQCDLVAMTTYDDGSSVCRLYEDDDGELLKIAETKSVSWRKRCRTS